MQNEAHTTVEEQSISSHSSIGSENGNLQSSKAAFQIFKDIMPAIARAHVETTIPSSLLQEFKSAESKGGVWKGEVTHTPLFEYWRGSFAKKSDRSSQVAQTIPPLPNPITPLLRTGTRIHSITSKECVSF